jgi:hypothetical protein
MSDTLEKILWLLASALISGAVSTLFFGLLKRALDRRLNAADEKEKRFDDWRKRRNIIEKQQWQALGRFMFWVDDAFTNGGKPHDGDISKAYSDFSCAETKSKELDREILATMEEGGNT